MIGIEDSDGGGNQGAVFGTIPSPPLNFEDCVRALDDVFSNINPIGDTKWAHIRGYLESMGLCGVREPSKAEKRFDAIHARIKARQELKALLDQATPHLPSELAVRLHETVARATPP